MMTRIALLIAMSVTLLTATGFAVGNAEKTQKLIDVLHSNATLFEKARACQQLGEIGTREAIPALAALLPDLHLSAYARSGLEGIPDPEAAAALRAALGTVKAQLLAGVINSLGTLRDAKATGRLSQLGVDPASGVSKEALLALGNISTRESIRVVERALASGPEPLRPEAAAACLLAAQRQQSDGNIKQARALFDTVRKANVPVQYRAAATRGGILARRPDHIAFLVEQLRSEDLAIRNAALLTIREIPDDHLASALNAELPRAKPDLQRQLLLALVDCHNGQSLAAIQAQAASHDMEIRKAALTALGGLGPTATVALVSALSEDRSAEDRLLAINGLRRMEGSAVDELLVQTLASTERSAVRIDLIHLLDSRGVTNAVPELLKLAAAEDRQVSLSAVSALKSLGGPAQLPTLISLTRSCTDQNAREAAEAAVTAVCARTGGADAVLAELEQATKTADRNSWVRVLATVGYAKALPAIKAAAQDPDESVADNALRYLGHWPDPAPVEDLLSAVEAGRSARLRRSALASVLDLATVAAEEKQQPETTIVAWLQRASPAVQSTEEKRRLLSVLGRLNTIESFRLALPCLDEADVQAEAALTVVQIAPALARTEGSSDVKTAVLKIASTAQNLDLRKRAAEVAKAFPDKGNAVSLFDGRTLESWEGLTNVWRVRDGLIVGGSMDGNPRNEFLATTRSYTNFLLRLEYKLVGTEGFINSGVQFHSIRVKQPSNEMSGFQADIGAGHSGCLYDESRRNKFLARAPDAQILKLEKPGQWNEYEVRCEGPRLRIKLNGEQTVDYTESDSNIPLSGLIGLQIHGGNKAEVSFRNIFIQELR